MFTFCGKIVEKKVDVAVQKASEGFSEEKRAIFYEYLTAISENLQKIVDTKENK